MDELESKWDRWPRAEKCRCAVKFCDQSKPQKTRSKFFKCIKSKIIFLRMKKSGMREIHHCRRCRPGPLARRFQALGFCQKFRVCDHVLLYKNSIAAGAPLSLLHTAYTIYTASTIWTLCLYCLFYRTLVLANALCSRLGEIFQIKRLVKIFRIPGGELPISTCGIRPVPCADKQGWKLTCQDTGKSVIFPKPKPMLHLAGLACNLHGAAARKERPREIHRKHKKTRKINKN